MGSFGFLGSRLRLRGRRRGFRKTIDAIVIKYKVGAVVTVPPVRLNPLEKISNGSNNLSKSLSTEDEPSLFDPNLFALLSALGAAQGAS